MKLFRAIWLAGVAILVCIIAQQQIALAVVAARAGTPIDLHAFREQAHVLARKPFVLLSYFALLVSALFYLCGPGRVELKRPEGRWLLGALVLSAFAYTYLLVSG